MTLESSTGSQGRKKPPKLVPNRELTKARINTGLSPNDFGLRAGVSGNTVRDAEAGFYVGPRVQRAICDAVGEPDLFALFPPERQKEFWPKKKGRR